MEKPDPNQVDDFADIQSEASDIAKSARSQLEATHDEFEGKMDEIGSRVKGARNRADRFKPESNNASGMTPSDARGMGVGLTVAYAIIGTPLFLYFVGLMIDKTLGTDANTGLKWSSALLMLGAVIGVWFAVMTTQKHNK